MIFPPLGWRIIVYSVSVAVGEVDREELFPSQVVTRGVQRLRSCLRLPQSQTDLWRHSAGPAKGGAVVWGQSAAVRGSERPRQTWWGPRQGGAPKFRRPRIFPPKPVQEIRRVQISAKNQERKSHVFEMIIYRSRFRSKCVFSAKIFIVISHAVFMNAIQCLQKCIEKVFNMMWFACIEQTVNDLELD